MGKGKKCIKCGKEVHWGKVVEDFEGILGKVDAYGEESLTEDEQLVYNGKVCSSECFVELDL